jgi:DNA-directed RNA polymerase subunit H
MPEDEDAEKQEFNVLNHELVPIHEVLSEDETRRLYELYNIIPEQLPKILASDPAAMAIGAKVNQVVRVRRKSKTAGESVAFRLVIDYPM